MPTSKEKPTTERKFTAVEIEADCPGKLEDLAKLITVHLDKAHRYGEKAEQNYTSVGLYFAEAQKVCDEGGFKAFRQKFFPSLGQSRVYELLQIASGRKSVEEQRAETRSRVRKHRAHKAASVTVTESDPQDAPASAVEDATASKQISQSRKSKNGVSPRDELSFRFTSVFVELARVTKSQNARRFIKAVVTADDLVRVGNLLSNLASLKKSRARPRTSSDVSTEQQTDPMQAMHAENDGEQVAAS